MNLNPSAGCFAVTALLMLASCESGRVPDGTRDESNAAGVAADSESPAPAAAALPDSSRVHVERVAVFLEAPAEAIDRVRAERSQADFAVIADDLMYYRATAYAYLDSLGVPIVRIVGRPPLTFLVAGRPLQYDFSSEPTLDLVVIYEPGQMPKALAPIEIHEAAEYYGFD